MLSDNVVIFRKFRSLERIAAKAPLYYKDFIANPRWLVMFIFARFVILRSIHRYLSRDGYVSTAPDPNGSKFSLTVDEDDFVRTLRNEGFATGLVLKEDVLKEIQTFAKSKPCFVNFDLTKPMLFDEHREAETKYGAAVLVAHFLDNIKDCPACLELSRDQRLISLARQYLGSEPKLISLRLWWSFHSGNATDADTSYAAQSYHFDLDDWNQVKFFFYLSDVRKTDGPHCYIKGSHKHKPLRSQLSLFVGRPEEEILEIYGRTSQCEIVGPAGLGFAEDSFGYHVGRPVEAGPRLLLEISFGSTGVMNRRLYGTH